MVQAETKCHGADASQRYIVPRQIDALKPVAFLEIAEAVPLLRPIRELRVHEVGDSLCSAVADCFRYQRIRRSLVPVLDHSENMHRRSQHFASLLEPAGGIERSISRIQFGRSNIELHRHKKAQKGRATC